MVKLVIIRPETRWRDIELAKSLVEVGVDVFLVTSSIPEPWSNSLGKHEQIKILAVGGRPGSSLWRLAAATKAIKPDAVVAIFSSFMLPYIAGLQFYLKCPVLHYVNAHPRLWEDVRKGVLTWGQAIRLNSRPMRVIEAVASLPLVSRLYLAVSKTSAPALVVVPSKRMYDEFLLYGVPRSKLRIVPWGIDVMPFRASRILLGDRVASQGRDERLVLFYGYGRTDRGADDMLTAFSSAIKYDNGMRLRMLVYEDQNSAIAANLQKRVHELGISAKVELLFGFRTRDEIAAHLADADLVVFPFKFSGSVIELPLSLMEAMAMGKMIVTTDVNATRELVGDYPRAILVPPNRPGQLTQALLTTSANPPIPGMLPRQYEIANTATLLKREILGLLESTKC